MVRVWQRSISCDQVVRIRQKSDSRHGHERVGLSRIHGSIEARLVELQKDYARQSLTCRNQYTNRPYTDDAVVAIVAISNDCDMGFHAPSGFYQDELTGLYNRWLAKHRNAPKGSSSERSRI